MKSRILQSIFILLIFSLVITACKKDVGESNDEELITTMVVTCTPQGGGAPLEFKFVDLDGPGGNDALQDIIFLEPNKTYNVAITLLNESANPAEDITEEVEEENQAHRFYYEPSLNSTVAVSDLNNDDDGAPLGTTCVWTTGAEGVSGIKITLRHYPGNPPDKQTPDPVNSPKSSTDISVDFVTEVE
jgi:hypothetical protein